MSLESEKFPFLKCASGNRALENFQELKKFPFLKCASGNRAVDFLGNFRETFGNFFETVLVVIGQESVLVGMWSPPISFDVTKAVTKLGLWCL